MRDARFRSLSVHNARCGVCSGTGLQVTVNLQPDSMAKPESRSFSADIFSADIFQQRFELINLVAGFGFDAK